MPAQKPARLTVWIDPAVCIGCTKCLDACPVDAIIGAPKHLHGVLTEQCIGCNLCLPPCPVNCIHPQDVPVSDDAVLNAKARHQKKKARQLQTAHEKMLADQTAENKFEQILAKSLKKSLENSRQKSPVFWAYPDE